ncbi:MAG: hypothetical protein ACI87H_002550 [Gammaproteobacteria bacterium]|jgi:hypothetical protein
MLPPHPSRTSEPLRSGTRFRGPPLPHSHADTHPEFTRSPISRPILSRGWLPHGSPERRRSRSPISGWTRKFRFGGFSRDTEGYRSSEVRVIDSSAAEVRVSVGGSVEVRAGQLVDAIQFFTMMEAISAVGSGNLFRDRLGSRHNQDKAKLNPLPFFNLASQKPSAQLSINQWVPGSSPGRGAKQNESRSRDHPGWLFFCAEISIKSKHGL